MEFYDLKTIIFAWKWYENRFKEIFAGYSRKSHFIVTGARVTRGKLFAANYYFKELPFKLCNPKGSRGIEKLDYANFLNRQFINNFLGSILLVKLEKKSFLVQKNYKFVIILFVYFQAKHENGKSIEKFTVNFFFYFSSCLIV